MESSYLPPVEVRVVHKTFVSRKAVAAFFRYCAQTKRLQQVPPPEEKPPKRLLH